MPLQNDGKWVQEASTLYSENPSENSSQFWKNKYLELLEKYSALLELKREWLFLLPHQPSLKQQQYHYPNADGAVCDIENGRKQGFYFTTQKWKPIRKVNVLGDVDHVHHIAH